MRGYLAARLILIVPTLLGVASLVFVHDRLC
jgi:ABC-type microcin C transport system permease subunit YejB